VRLRSTVCAIAHTGDTLSSNARLRIFAGLALLAAMSCWSASAQSWNDLREIKHVFVIALENHNWTQPARPQAHAVQTRSPRGDHAQRRDADNGLCAARLAGRFETLTGSKYCIADFHECAQIKQGPDN